MQRPESAIRLQDIEARQDEVLSQLEELERRVEDVLRETLTTMPRTFVLPAAAANSPTATDAKAA